MNWNLTTVKDRRKGVTNDGSGYYWTCSEVGANYRHQTAYILLFGGENTRTNMAEIKYKGLPIRAVYR